MWLNSRAFDLGIADANRQRDNLATRQGRQPTMKHRILTAASIAIISGPIFSSTYARTPSTGPEVSVNRGIVELETTRSAGISVRIAEDIANVIDDGATRRVLPVIGKGALENLTDLKLLRGIDMAVLQTDVLDYAKQQNLFPGIDYWLTYITKLYNEEFHLLARQDIKTVNDLAHQRVNVDLREAGTAITAARLFELLKIPVAATNDDQGVAIEKLRKGEVAAIAFVAGKPAPLFHNLNGNDGLHLLSIPLTPVVTAAYIMCRPGSRPRIILASHRTTNRSTRSR